jgi:vacuolar-type H+-ATPase subunit E/Vma4
MPGSDLTTELRERAEERAQALMRAARTDATRIIEQASAELEARRSAMLESSERAYRYESRASIASARHEAMRAVLLARERMLERVLERVRALLPEASRSEGYRKGLGLEVAQAVEFVGATGAIVRCSEGLDTAIGQVLEGEAVSKVEPLSDGRHGFVVVGEEGRVQVDGTLESRLERLTPSLAIELRARVEEPPG